jgi:hypothetical protein
MATATQIELFLGPLIDPTTGGLCSGYTVYFYAAGGTTPKNVWTEPAMTNPFTSYTLDAAGKALLYGVGLYRIVVNNTNAAPVLTLDNIRILSYTEPET